MDVATEVRENRTVPEESDHRFSYTDRELLVLLRRDLRYIREDIDRMDKKLDQTAPLKMFEDHEARLRTLEQFRWWILGGGALAAFLGGIVAHFIWH